MRRPAPPSAWCSGRAACWASAPTGAMPTSWSRRSTTARLSGLSLDGSPFFYENPLESRGNHHRWTWHRCPCCPPNIGRMVASIGSYMYGVSDDAIAVHLYGESTAQAECRRDAGHARPSAPNYPWDGAVAITIGLEAPAAFASRCACRPGAARRRCRSMARRSMRRRSRHDGYLRDRPGMAGRRQVDARPGDGRRGPSTPIRRCKADIGRVAIARGPLIYCVEEVDNAPGLNALIVADDAEMPACSDRGSSAALWRSTSAPARALAGWDGKLYGAANPSWRKRRPASCPIISGTTGRPARCSSGSGREDERISARKDRSNCAAFARASAR